MKIPVLDSLLYQFFVYVFNFYHKHRPSRLAGVCVFNPTCSDYLLQALKIHGTVIGLFLFFKRILKCRGGIYIIDDPVPSVEELKKHRTSNNKHTLKSKGESKWNMSTESSQ